MSARVQCSGAKRYALPCQRTGRPNYGDEFYCHDHEDQAHEPDCLFARLYEHDCTCGASDLLTDDEITEALEAVTPEEWADLEDELRELERTDPAVAAAAKRYDDAVRSVTRRPR